MIRKSGFRKITYQESLDKLAAKAFSRKIKKPTYEEQKKKLAERQKRTAERQKVAKMEKAQKKAYPKLLWSTVTDYIKRRDSLMEKIQTYQGHCCSCGELASGGNFQGGHWEPSGSNGVWARYHPHNIHGQCRNCNVALSRPMTEKAKNGYTIFMVKRYGINYVENLRKRIKYNAGKLQGDRLFYEKMMELYKSGNENNIIKYLDFLEATIDIHKKRK